MSCIPRCAGIDCSKKDAKVCVRIQGQGGPREVGDGENLGATTGRILALREHLIGEKVSCVVIESTSGYSEAVLLPARRRLGRGPGQRRGGA